MLVHAPLASFLPGLGKYKKNLEYQRLDSLRAAMSRSPSCIAGHYIRRHGMCSLGVRDEVLAFAVGPSTIAVAEVASLEANSSFPWPIEQFRYCSLPKLGDGATQSITVLHLHPSADWLCVGTKQSGLYLTRASVPSLTAETQLPVGITGEYIHCVCFVSSSNQNGEKEEYLVYSSTVTSRPQGDRSPYRLAVWSLRHGTEVWMGAADPLYGMCSFDPCSFAACSSNGMVNLFSLRIKERSEEAEEEDIRSRFMLVSRTCSGTDQWAEQPQFICCAARQKRGKIDDDFFLALTSNGYLVKFNKSNGSVLSWMDCKDTKASSLCVSSNLVAISGNAVRYFDSSTWEFCGKQVYDARSWNGVLSSIVSVSTILLPTRSITFLNTGGLVVCAANRGAKSNISFSAVHNYVPLADNGSEKVPQLHWIQPAVESQPNYSIACGLWCSQGIRIVDTSLNTNVQSSPLRFECGDYNPEWNLFVAQCSQTKQLHAFDPQDMWEKKASFGVSTQLKSIAMNDSGVVAALGVDDTLFYFACRWIMSGVGCMASLTLEHRSQRELRVPLRFVLFAGDKLFGVTNKLLIDLASNVEYSWSENILQAKSLNGRLLLLFAKHCELFSPAEPENRLNVFPLPFTADSTSSLVVESSRRRLAVVEHLSQIVIFDVEGSGAPLLFFEHQPELSLRILLLGLIHRGKDAWRLVVGDSKGMISLYNVEMTPTRGKGRVIRASTDARDSSSSLPTAPKPRDSAPADVNRNSAAPSSHQLSSRLSELSDFFKTHVGATTPRGGPAPTENSTSPAAPVVKPSEVARAAPPEPKEREILPLKTSAEPTLLRRPAPTAYGSTGVSAIDVSDLTVVVDASSNQPTMDVVRHDEDAPVIRSPSGSLSGDEPLPRPQSELVPPEEPPVSRRSPTQKPAVKRVVVANPHMRREPSEPSSAPSEDSIRRSALQVQQSLLQLNALLAASRDETVGRSAGELSQLVNTLTTTLQHPALLRNGIDSSRSSSLSMDQSQVLRSDMLRLQQQTQRLEEQNQEILKCLQQQQR